jgi:hypothetical protein
MVIELIGSPKRVLHEPAYAHTSSSVERQPHLTIKYTHLISGHITSKQSRGRQSAESLPRAVTAAKGSYCPRRHGVLSWTSYDLLRFRYRWKRNGTCR